MSKSNAAARRKGPPPSRLRFDKKAGAGGSGACYQTSSRSDQAEPNVVPYISRADMKSSEAQAPMPACCFT